METIHAVRDESSIRRERETGISTEQVLARPFERPQRVRFSGLEIP